MESWIRLKSRAVYLIFLTVSAFGAYLLNDRFGYTPLLFLVLLAPVDAVCVRLVRRGTHLNPPLPFQESRRGDPVFLSYSWQNRSRFLFCRIFVSLSLTGPEGVPAETRKISFVLSPKTSETLRAAYSPAHIGIYRMQLKKVRICGPLGLFSLRFPAGPAAVSAAVPSGGEEEIPGADAKAGLDESSDKIPHGDRNSGSYDGVREYAPGDLLRNIHWKLTAHTRKIMTCLYEEAEDFVTVAVDLRPWKGPAEEALCVHDRLCESAYRSICSLVARGAKVRAVFLSGEERKTLWVKSEAGLLEAAVGLASARPSYQSLSGMQGIFPAAGEVLVTGAHLDGDLSLLLCGYSGPSRKALFHYIAPAGFRQESAAAYFNVLSEHGVSYRILRASPAQKNREQAFQIKQSSALIGREK